MHSRHKDGLSTDPVHVDASASLQVIEMDVAKLGDQVDHIVLSTDLRERVERGTSGINT